MTLVPVKSSWLILAMYPAVGLLLGLADPILGRLAQQLGAKPGMATAVSVNLVLPLAAVALGIAGARMTSALLGAAMMTGGLVVGLAVQYSGGRGWSPVALLSAIPPVLVVATLGYAVLGTISALATTRYCRP
jgi:hypothetical protein